MLKAFSKKEYVLLTGYLIALFGLFFYTFTQIDLSLALSRNESLQTIVRSFQQIGYFQRPLSADLFFGILVIFYVFYILFLVLAAKKKIDKRFAWTLIIVSAAVLVFSYNAFSYDIFNYIFDAKIFTHYGENPYLKKALDYPNDPMLSFMRWTHRTYPYGPIWLGITVPFSFIGFQFFLPTFFLFKLFITASFIGSCYYIGKILQKISPQREVQGLLFFGLNPLILIESVVSAHIDIVMMFFSLWAIYLLIREKHIFSYLALFLSIGIKFATGLLLPIFMLVHVLQRKSIKIHWGTVFVTCLLLMIGGVILQTSRGNFQPWYLIDVLTFAALISSRYIVIIPTIVISFFALCNYLPFLFYGNWDKPIPQMISNMNIFSYSSAFFIVAVYFFYQQIQFARSVQKKKQKNENK